MLKYNCRLCFYNLLKKGNVYCMGIVNTCAKRKILTSSKVPPPVGPLQCFNSLFDSSAKPFLDISKIYLLDKFFEPQSELRCTYNFVVNESVAKDIVDHILASSDKKNRIFVEGNPGVGLITINLINAHGTRVLVVDNSKLQELSLTQILNKYPNVVSDNFGNLNKDVTAILKSFDFAKENDLTLSFILTTTSFYFIRVMVVLFLKYNLRSTNFEMYLVLSSSVYESLRNYIPKNLKFLPYCAFNLLFHTEEIATYPCSAFLPNFEGTNENMTLVKITSNQKSYFKDDELIYYVVFISVLGRRSSNFLIPTLEKWLPDCGPNLISKGISMTNQIRDFSFEESITLFKFFQNCEGYEDFKSSTLKMYEESYSLA